MLICILLVLLFLCRLDCHQERSLVLPRKTSTVNGMSHRTASAVLHPDSQPGKYLSRLFRPRVGIYMDGAANAWAKLAGVPRMLPIWPKLPAGTKGPDLAASLHREKHPNLKANIQLPPAQDDGPARKNACSSPEASQRCSPGSHTLKSKASPLVTQY